MVNRLFEMCFSEQLREIPYILPEERREREGGTDRGREGEGSLGVCCSKCIIVLYSHYCIAGHFSKGNIFSHLTTSLK